MTIKQKMINAYEIILDSVSNIYSSLFYIGCISNNFIGVYYV